MAAGKGGRVGAGAGAARGGTRLSAAVLAWRRLGHCHQLASGLVEYDSEELLVHAGLLDFFCGFLEVFLNRSY